MSLKYRPEIDGLRALAVIPVILFHAGFGFAPGGFIGVDIFFVISGYLISTIIFRELEADTFSLLNFYERRARRILPALFFIMTICLPFAWFWLNYQQWEEFSKSLIWTSLFSSNIFFWSNSDYFASAAEFKPLLHTWSLAVEEQFYVFFPLIAMALWNLKKWVLPTSLIIIGLASFALCIWAAPKYPEANFFLTPFRVWELMIGTACAVIIKKWTGSVDNYPVREFMSLIGIGCIIYSIARFNETTLFPSAIALIPVIGSALVIISATPKTIVGRVLSLSPLVGIGLISYSAYLWHHVIFAFARIKLSDTPEPLIMIVLSAISIALAFFTWRFVEQPFRKKSAPQSAKQPGLLKTRSAVFISSLTGIAVLSSVGLLQANAVIEPTRIKTIRTYVEAVGILVKKRNLLIRQGSCEMWPVSKWKEWDCDAGTGLDKDLIPLPIAIIGDSHASDKAMMLRMNGYSPTQITGGACPINPKVMSKPCKDFFLFAIEKIKRDESITEVWISNRFNANELTDKAIENTLNFWRIETKTLVFFSAMPQFGQPNGPNWDAYDLSSRPLVKDKLKTYGVRFVDMKDIVCETPSKCLNTSKEKQILYVDKDHLSPIGAEIFGKKLIEIMSID